MSARRPPAALELGVVHELLEPALHDAHLAALEVRVLQDDFLRDRVRRVLYELVLTNKVFPPLPGQRAEQAHVLLLGARVAGVAGTRSSTMSMRSEMVGLAAGVARLAGVSV
jgi:hypothetical protein